jgi:hypothetical protein
MTGHVVLLPVFLLTLTGGWERVRQPPPNWQATEAGRRIIAYLTCLDLDCSAALRDVSTLESAAVEPLAEVLSKGLPPDLLSRIPGDAPVAVRLKAVVALGSINDPRATRLLGALVRDPHPLVRAEACTGLGRARGDTAALGALVNALRDPDPLVRENAVRALGALGNPDAVPALTAARERETADHIRSAIDAAVRALIPR